ncbi:DddA-like double-stranded DNA deaminase toxin [Nocardia huaxiensis]|uniref:DddA-like double-stranded DNA deaminase toxin n=1 Tax=Nocardia huaxiensis TaxID=2755382 RepID=UPI001E3B0E30|nr:DddA-like double-stranded DNA deaminase toxin [Nocardia huaxiensis]UFS95535.1 hypothetical protein LPY97_33480 [Nocardia huaxiensis]
MTINVRNEDEATRTFARIRSVQDMTSRTSAPTSSLQEVSAPLPLHPRDPGPKAQERIEQLANDPVPQPKSDTPGSVQPATPPQSTLPGGQSAPTNLNNADRVDPSIAVNFPGLINPDGTVRTPEQGYTVDVPPPPFLGTEDIQQWPAPGESKTLPSGATVTGDQATGTGSIEIDGTTYPGNVVATTTVVILPGQLQPFTAVDTKITVAQPHPRLGGTGWTATLGDNNQPIRIDIANPTTGMTSVAMTSAGLRITNTSGMTMTVNTQGQPDGPFENYATGERGVAEPLPGGGYRAKFHNGAVTEYDADGNVLSHTPAPDTSSPGDGWVSRLNDLRLAAGQKITDGIARVLGGFGHSFGQGAYTLGSVGYGGPNTPQGMAFAQVAAADAARDPSTEWKNWLGKLSIKGTTSAAGHLLVGLFAMTDIGAVINAAGEVLGFHPNLPDFDNTIAESAFQNAQAAKAEFDKGNPVGGWNHVGMATGLLPDFRDPNSVLLWGALFGTRLPGGKGDLGTPGASVPAPVKPVPKPTEAFGLTKPNSSPATSVMPMKDVLASQPGLTKFDLGKSTAQQGLELSQLQQRMAEIREAGKNVVAGVEQHVQLQAEISRQNAIPARAHSGTGESSPTFGGGSPDSPTGSGSWNAADRTSGPSGHADTSASSRDTSHGPGAADRDSRSPLNLPGVQKAFEDLPGFQSTGTGGKTIGFVLDDDGNRIPLPFENPYEPLWSGAEEPYKQAAEMVKGTPAWPYAHGSPGWAYDVEMKAIVIARQLGIKNPIIVINHSGGPCPGCLRTLPFLPDPNGTITIVWPGGKATYNGSEIPKFSEGER